MHEVGDLASILSNRSMVFWPTFVQKCFLCVNEMTRNVFHIAGAILRINECGVKQALCCQRGHRRKLRPKWDLCGIITARGLRRWSAVRQQLSCYIDSSTIKM